MIARNKHLTAAWQLFLRDRNAMSVFDGTAKEALISFRASITALPFYVFLFLLGPESLASQRSLIETGLLHAVFYVLIWTVWPVVMIRVARVAGREQHYFRYLSAYNWSMVIQAAIWLAAFAITALFGLTDSPARIVTVIAVCTVALYHIHILREALEITTGWALGIAMLKLFLYQILLGTHHAALLQPSGS